ncbi:MAG TPA: SpoIIE family protein phosphatase [Candidatus Anoxymicrobiaceae bacterium]
MCPISCHGGPGVECSVAARPMIGQAISGDTFVCHPFEGGTLVCAIDGLGHGEEAAVASELAKEIMERHASESLIDLLKRCDSQMKHTRGAVASLARFDTDEHTLSWLGVGNVDGVLYHHGSDGKVERESMASRGGVIGYMMPSLRVSTFELRAGDTLVLATDGLSGGFSDHIEYHADLSVIVSSLLQDYGKTGDDALVIAARYTGGPS